MSELKQSIAQLLIDNFKGATSKKASDMAIAIMAFVNADREREIESAFCGTPGTGECSCRKFADNPLKCDNRRTQPEATKPAQDLGAAILALPLPQPVGHVEYSVPGEPMTRICAGYSPEQIRQLLKAAAALASPADALIAGDSEPTDTEMLDFVTREKVTIYLETERRKVPLTDGSFNYRYENVPVGWTLGVTSGTFETPRAAISAAIQAQKDGHG